MRILVAGASGVLGTRLVPALVAAGHEVIGTTRRQEHIAAVAKHGATVVIMDAMDKASVAAAFEAADPEVIIHELTDLAHFDYAANAALRTKGTAHIVAAALDLGIDRVIGQSISWAYEEGEAPASEDEPLARTIDGAASYPGVEALEHEIGGLPLGVVLRYGLLYGPGTWFEPGGVRMLEASTGRIEATSDHTSFVHVDDAVSATVAALDWPAGAYNVVDDEPTTAAEWAPVLARAAGFVGTPEVSIRSRGRSASNAKARALGWAPAHPSWRHPA